MKHVRIIINYIIIPLFTTLFILAVGGSSAGISAIFEYCVLREFFTSKYLSFLPAPAIALLLVVVFEFTKLYLHFLRGHLKKTMETQVMSASGSIPTQTTSLLSRTKAILGVLIAISFLCTIIFTVTTFHLASYNEEEIQAEITTINSELQQDIDNLKTTCQKEYDQNIAPFLENKNTAAAALATFDPHGLGPRATNETYKALQIAADTATEEYNTAVTNFTAQKEKKIADETALLQSDADSRIAQLSDTSNPDIAAKYDNPILGQFLTVLAQTLFHAGNYSRGAYLWLTILLSIVISLILEYIIGVCFYLLSYPLETLAENIDMTAKLKQWCNELVLTLLKASCALFICIIISFWTAPMNKLQFGNAILACMISIALVQKFVTPRHTDNSEVHTTLIYTVRDSLLEGIISFMGYILLGFVFGKEALTLDLPTVAIGIGSTLSGCISYVPQYLITNLNATLDKT